MLREINFSHFLATTAILVKAFNWQGGAPTAGTGSWGGLAAMGGREDGGGISAAVEEKEGPRAKPCNATVDVGQGVAALPGIMPPSAGAGT